MLKIEIHFEITKLPKQKKSPCGRSGCLLPNGMERRLNQNSRSSWTSAISRRRNTVLCPVQNMRADFLGSRWGGETVTGSKWMGTRPRPPGDGEVPRQPRALQRGHRMDRGWQGGVGNLVGEQENRLEGKNMQRLHWFNQSTDFAVRSYSRFTLDKLSNNLSPAQESQTPSAGGQTHPCNQFNASSPSISSYNEASLLFAQHRALPRRSCVSERCIVLLGLWVREKANRCAYTWCYWPRK